MTLTSRLLVLLGILALSLCLISSAKAAYSDPPGRVARLSDSRGSISYSPSGENVWLNSVRNRPVIRGDRLWSARGARAELQVGSAAIRMGANTSLEVLDLSDQLVLVRLTQGTLNVSVRRLYRGQTIEIATPTLALVIDRAGSYRIDVDARRDVTTVVVWNGDGRAYGERASFPLRSGDAVQFYSSDLRDYQNFSLPREDAFDRYSRSRDERLERSASLRYVDDDLIGYADLDQYGSWSANRNYGNIWFPTQVSTDWAPYRDGHWVWQEPWGWTWVDDAPWGFAPSHYGRWVSISNRWGWVPGPRNTRPIYAPALVAFVGGRSWNASISRSGGSYTGWFPLGPRDAYLPSYQASRQYFTQVNVSNTVINTTTINSVYSNFSSGRIDVAQPTYRNRGVSGAVTAVPNAVFVNAKPVAAAQLQLDVTASGGGEILRLAAVAPSAQSVLGRAELAQAKPDQATFSRDVIARSKPAAQALPFAARAAQLQRNPGMAVTPSVTGNRSAEVDRNIRVVAATSAAVNARELGSRRDAEGPSEASGKPAQLQQLDRSVDVQALVPEAVEREPGRAGSESKPRQDGSAVDPRREAANAQAQREEQARQQQMQLKEEQRKEEQRQQDANAQLKRDEQAQREEQARQQQTQRKEEQRQQDANAQTKRDEQAQREEQARQQEAQRKEEQRQQDANAQAQRAEQARQEQEQQKVPQEQSPPAEDGNPSSRKEKDKEKDAAEKKDGKG